jgi:predicted nucleic acid-binding protein
VTYFDTGYLAKCYLNEPDSSAVQLLAAFHRKLRENALSSATLEIVLRQFDLDEQQSLWTWLPLTDAIMAAVVSAFRTLPPSVFLRTGDAIHLATARSQSLPEVWSGDARLIAAAPHFGLVGRSLSGQGDRG